MWWMEKNKITFIFKHKFAQKLSLLEKLKLVTNFSYVFSDKFAVLVTNYSITKIRSVHELD